MDCGARIERGRIAEVTADGYSVASYDRDGIVTPPIPAMDDTAYKVDDNVYFFLFWDGTGKILCSM